MGTICTAGLLDCEVRGARMKRYHRFYPVQIGRPTPTQAVGARGTTAGLKIESAPFTCGGVLLRWYFINLIDDDIAPTCFRVHVDGECRTVIVDDDRVVLEGLRAGVSYNIDVIPMSAAENDLWQDDPSLFDAPATGNRVRITMAEVDLATDPDFESREIYWDNSREDANCDTLLDTAYGAETKTYTTEALDEQDYSFCVLNVYDNGNKTAKGSAETIAVDTYPKQVDSEAITYNQSTRKVTISGTVPAGQAADVVGYTVYSNYLPGVGLQDYLMSDRWAQITLTQPVVAALSYTIPFELFAGDWLFAIRAVDGNGHESNFTTLSLTLEQDGSDLTEEAAKPAAPYDITAVASAAGVITVTVQHAGSAPVPTHIRFYRDGAQDNEQAFVVGTSEYSYTTGALTNDTEYDFKALARNGTTLSDFSDTVSETADDTGPSTSTAITLELVY